jgi:hypothetical protein
MRSSDAEVLRFFGQLRSKSVFITGSSGPCLTSMWVSGIVFDPSPDTFALVGSLGEPSFKLIFKLSACEFERVEPSGRSKETWNVRLLPTEDFLRIELL